jgi:hypothetical protein
MEFRRKSLLSFSPLLICLAALFFSGPAKGGDKAAPAPVVSGSEGAVSPVSWETNLEISGVARSPFEDQRAIGKVEMLDSSFSAIGSYQANAGISVRFGLVFQRDTFGSPDNSPLPDRLQAFHLTLGTDLQLGEAWLVRFEAQPGFYGDDAGIRGRDLSCPMVLGASYFLNADLQLVAGVSYDPDRKYPVLPGIGFRWKFAADWVVDAIFPTPRIEYSLNKSLMLYAGADIRSDTYRMSGDFGRSHGIPQLDNSVLDYTEIRAGIGAAWKINSVLSMEIESGCVLVDQFDFHRDDVRFRSTEIPPYGGISLKAAF